ncbi:aminobenzoyl-glutamate transporter [Enterovibrio norvegicus FF-33]|uniref:Aminobenzoyl-glutamate transporter n=1 Tax=Enterovibrio norvegicus FF-454 TaxID=1185651 RepID=A0A1E5C3W3_9GAMM|nr:AbgT family transporter [Enterovibrio norvegicus]OEE59872.1 aminobenzoyl-glutamate transporter [Enterovibrio norvegicus FF-454]OEE69873.1 aminobenzoyl-glutamate transporter [Enterovibrio norvegicus FF-33]OEE87972.1 aminobenzoyl-glutamate transporter [Enterovibrio norvegicus FF-162]
MSNHAMDNIPDAPMSAMDKFLNGIEKAGNKIPDPALLFFYGLLIVWGLSAVLSQVDFGLIHPISGQTVEINNLLTGTALANFLANMVTTFTSFAPMGIVLVAMLGVGVADASGFITTGLKKMLNVTPKKLLTPALILVAIVSHTAADAGYVLVIPLGGIIFHAAGRHPLVGIAAAFAGVSGGFSANFIPSGIDPLLAGFTQSAAQVLDKDYLVNPLANIYFTGLSSILIVAIGWYVTEKIIEPRLSKLPIDDDAEKAPDLGSFTDIESKAFNRASFAMLAGIALLVFALIPETSALRSPEGELTAFSAPLMKSIVPLIFILFVIPGVVYGRVAGTFKKQGDIIVAMSQTMSTMGSYLVMSFFCAQFLAAFSQSNIGTLLALEGAELLKALNMPGQMTIIGMILLTACVNLLIGSASAKWALIGPILVPMLMALGISPELSQAGYRVGDSVSNIISPLMVFFPLVVVYCQRYVKNTGIGTLASMMMPYSIAMLIGWSLFLLAYWALGIPLGIQAPYTYQL